MHHVFVSYSRTDVQWAEALVAELTRRGLRTWVDRRDIALSVPWFDEVRDAIDEADLFLVCRSDLWLGSPACAAEYKIAQDRGKPCAGVEVGGDIPESAAEVQTWLAQASAVEYTRTELRVRARDWDRAGRPRGALVGRALRRRLATALPRETQEGHLARSFLAAARRLSRLRLAGAVLTALLTLGAVFAGVVVFVADQKVEQANLREAETYRRTAGFLRLAESDPYDGLAAAAGSGGEESVAKAIVIEKARGYGVPDDAFTMGERGRAFLRAPIGEEVAVLAEDGSVWKRRADDRDTRTASRSSGTARTPNRGDLTARTVPDTSIVEVSRGRRFWRRVVVSGEPGATSFSPDGRRLAVAVGDQVELVDLGRGLVRRTLRGAPASITDVAWTSDGDRIWAVAGTMSVSWSARNGTVVHDAPGHAFVGLFPAASPDAVWIADEERGLREVEVSGAGVRRMIPTGGALRLAVGDRWGRHALTLTEDGVLSLVGLADGSRRRVPVPGGCALGRPAFSEDGTEAYLPCIGGQLHRLAVASGALVGAVDGGESGVGAVAPRPGGGALVGSRTGEVLSYVPGTAARLVYQVTCRPFLLGIAVSADGGFILPVGHGTGSVGCTELVRFDPEGEPKHGNVFDFPQDSVLSRAAVFDPSGRALAIGYSDGTVSMRPIPGISPGERTVDLVGDVTAMLTLTRADGGSDLLVATRAGVLQRLPWCPDCLTNRYLAAQAAESLWRARTLGLTTWQGPRP